MNKFKQLLAGVRDFQRGPFLAKQTLYESLASGQQPLALFITCSDSRIDPNLITNTEPGELFVIRNAGNIVPPYGASAGGEAATIEYAIDVLKIDDIIICGHSKCGAMAGKIAPESVAQLPAVKDWLRFAEDSRSIVPREYGRIFDAPDPLTNAIEDNILVQLEHLRTHPSVASAEAEGRLTLYGWVYTFETGQVHAYDESARRFLPIEAMVD